MTTSLKWAGIKDMFNSFLIYHLGKTSADLAKVAAEKDPCAKCGHGRAFHKKQAYMDLKIGMIDEAMSVTQCRHGHFCAQEPKVRQGCECLEWAPILVEGS